MMNDTQKKIDQETANIAILEASYPIYHNDVGKWDEKNTPYHIHHTEVRDAYWRRRMLKTKEFITEPDNALYQPYYMMEP